LGYDITFVTTRHVLEAPPNTPSLIVGVLEEAFSRAVKELAYIEWAKKNYVIIDPLSAQELRKEVAKSYAKVEKFKGMLE
jgi:tripartite-type tricarboxylate transporter receptor subunit TctC